MQNSEQLIVDKNGEPAIVDVLGWGENSLGQVTGKAEVPRYHQPVVLSEFTGKKIISVGCHKASSSAIESGGNIYEWGGIETSPITLGKTITGAEEIHYGNNFSVVKAGDKLYFWGEIRNKSATIISEREPTVISGDSKVKAVSVGFDHVLAQDTDGYVGHAYLSSWHLGQTSTASLLWRAGWTARDGSLAATSSRNESLVSGH